MLRSLSRSRLTSTLSSSSSSSSPSSSIPTSSRVIQSWSTLSTWTPSNTHSCTSTSTCTTTITHQPVRAYHQNVIDHYENPRNVGSLPKDDKDVGTGVVGAPACGDVMKLQVRVDENGTVVEAKFKTFGCGSAIASSSLATSWLTGRNIEEALTIKNTDIAAHLNLPPVKLHCSMLAEDAIKAAIKDYQNKQQQKQQQQATA